MNEPDFKYEIAQAILNMKKGCNGDGPGFVQYNIQIPLPADPAQDMILAHQLKCFIDSAVRSSSQSADVNLHQVFSTEAHEVPKIAECERDLLKPEKVVEEDFVVANSVGREYLTGMPEPKLCFQIHIYPQYQGALFSAALAEYEKLGNHQLRQGQREYSWSQLQDQTRVVQSLENNLC